MSGTPHTEYLSAGDVPVELVAVADGIVTKYLSHGDVQIDFYPTPPDALPQSGPIICFITSSYAMAGVASNTDQGNSNITSSVGLASP